MLRRSSPQHNYLTKAMPEMAQPKWLLHAKYGMYSPKTRLRDDVQMVTHPNFWPDKDGKTNAFLRSSTLQKERNTLIGAAHSENNGTDFEHRADGVGMYTQYEMENKFFFKGLMAPAVTNTIQEPFWANRLYALDAHINDKSLSPSQKSQLVFDHTRTWWTHLEDIIKTNYEAVGALPDGKFRDTRYAFEAFMRFEDAMMSRQFSEGYLATTLTETCPKGLEDIYGVFIEMEANRVKLDYCPRCSQPHATTRFCGQGVNDSPFRKHQGMWVPHKHWSHEWYTTVCNRAEALFAKSIEHPLFGAEFHTQRQVEALMRVYDVTSNRGRANAFMQQIRASNAYHTGHIKETPKLLEHYNAVMDRTSHATLLTNGFRVQPGVQKYLGASAVPQSARRLRIDLELDKMRREQRETGVVRVPPEGYNLSMNDVVEYKTDDKGNITNWRDVKASLEKSFLNDRLPDSSYVEKEEDNVLSYDLLRELEHWEAEVARLRDPKTQATIDAENKSDEKSIPIATRFVFPDDKSYRYFNTDAKAIEACGFPGLKHGDKFSAQRKVFLDPTKIKYDTEFYDVRDELCQQFGYTYGTRFEIEDGQNFAIVCGVRSHGRKATLCAFTDDGEILAMGHTRKQVATFLNSSKWRAMADPATLDWVEKEKTLLEECEGVVIGVRAGKVWASFAPGATVAQPLGVSRKMSWTEFKVLSSNSAIAEPASWNVPFRNNWAEENLEAAMRAPWEKMPYATLIPGKLTPKRMQFGLTQHIKTDDFVTKEYDDRLRSKQFFTKPNAFQVIPDSYETAPSLDGKNDSIYRHGLPGVDRKELVSGWADAEDVPEDEVAAVEQAIRDISGNRPGNYYRREAELSQFEINADWWNIKPFWAHSNKEENLKPHIERKIVKPSDLPFRGTIPVLGTAAGMGDRFSSIVNDLKRGFGTGPSGHTRLSQPRELPHVLSQHSDVMKGSDLVLRMFNDKLKSLNITRPAFVYSVVGHHPKEMMIAINEWEECGKPPTAMLREALADFLSNEIASYNSKLPDGLPKIDLSNDGCLSVLETSHWADQDRVDYALTRSSEENKEVDGDAELIALEGFVRYRYVQQRLYGGSVTSIRVEDQFLERWCRQTYLDDFSSRLAAVINKDVPEGFRAAVASAREAELRNVNQWLTEKNLAEFLNSLGLHDDDVKYILQQAPPLAHTLAETRRTRGGQGRHDDKHGLAQYAQPNSPKLYHVGAFLSWNGQATSTTAIDAKSTDAKHTEVANKGTSLMETLGGGGGRNGPRGKMYTPVREVLKLVPFVLGDGVAMDLKYVARENKNNAGLKKEFVRLVSAIVPESCERRQVVLDMLYDDYCDGLWVPNESETLEMLSNFIRTAARVKDSEQAGMLLRRANETRDVLNVHLAPVENLPFEFENVRHERNSTIEHFRKNGIRAGRDFDDAAKAICISNRKDKVDYQRYGLDDARGRLGYGDDVSRDGISDNNLAGEKFRTDLQALSKNLNLDGSFTKLVNDPNNLVAFARRVLQRHLPLLAHYHELRQTVLAHQDDRKHANQSEMANLRAVFDIREKDKTKQPPLAFVDNLVGFRMNPEEYWRSLLRNPSARMLTAHHYVNQGNDLSAMQSSLGSGGRSNLGGATTTGSDSQKKVSTDAMNFTAKPKPKPQTQQTVATPATKEAPKQAAAPSSPVPPKQTPQQQQQSASSKLSVGAFAAGRKDTTQNLGLGRKSEKVVPPPSSSGAKSVRTAPGFMRGSQSTTPRGPAPGGAPGGVKPGGRGGGTIR
eukprot:PhM_4_TR16168/c3_g2_i1/m.24502